MSHSDNVRTCRLCLGTKFTHSVFMDVENGWLELLEFCVGIVITPEDEPRILCAQCAEQIDNYVKFKKQCLKSDLLWKSLVKFDVKCYADADNCEPVIAKYDEEYLDSDVAIGNNHEFETYLEDSKEIIDQKDGYGEETELYRHTDLNRFKENIRKFTKNEKSLGSNDVASYHGENIEIKKELSIPENVEINKIIEVKDHVLCPKCNKEYANKKWLSRHMTVCDGKLNKEYKKKEPTQDFLCGICDFIGIDVNSVNQHLDEHFSNNELNCKLCDFNAVDLASMETHRYSHQSNDSKSFHICHKCSKRFGSLLSLEFHYRSLHLGKPGGLCTLCNNREFKIFKTWRRHDKSHKITRFICDHCGRKYVYRYLIEAHLKDHSNVKNFVCDECGKRFKRMHGLKLHVSTVHVKTEPLKCTHCSKIFKSPHTLEKHMKRIFAEKSYQCEVCSKCFASERSLKEHFFWHTEERPHGCDICGSSYKAKSQLKLHMRKHTGEKPYRCLQCYKTFHSSGQLKRHNSVHTGVRPVKCTSLYCDKTFYSNGARLAHWTKRHKIDDENDSRK